MIPDETNQPALPSPGAPDSILAELWEVKREINRAADYRIDTLVQMAHEAAECIRQQWKEDGRNSGLGEKGLAPFSMKRNDNSA